MTAPSNFFKILLNSRKTDWHIPECIWGIKHGRFELDLHYSTHLTHTSVSENLISTLTMRHRRKWKSGHLVRSECSVQVQGPLSPELPFWNTVRKTGGCSNMLPSGLRGYCWYPRRRLQKVFQKKLCHELQCHRNRAPSRVQKPLHATHTHTHLFLVCRKKTL